MSRLPTLILAAVFTPLVSACAVAPVPAAPDALAVDGRVPVPAAVQEARERVRNQDRGGALMLLRGREGLSVAEPERSWLLVMVWRLQCAKGRARRSALALPTSDIAHALQAVTSEEPLRALERLRAQRSISEPGWRHLAAAHLHARLEDYAEVAASAARACRSPRDFVRHEALLVRGRALVEEGRLGPAERAADAAAALDPTDTRPLRLRAEIERRRGEAGAAVQLLARALSAAPASEHAARRIVDLLREDVDDAAWEAVAACVDALSSDGAPANPERVGLEGMVHEWRGREADAVVCYQRALRAGAIAMPFDRRLRRLLLVRGRYREAFELLRRAVPPAVSSDPANLLQSRWEALSAAVARVQSDGPVPEARIALARACVGVGALTEAVVILEDLEPAEARDLQRRVSGQLAFERALRALIESGYRGAMRKEEVPDFDHTLADVVRLAKRHLVPADHAAFAAPRRGSRSVPFIGTWLDHGSDTSSPVVAHFRKYGRFLMLGQRGGEPTEAIVLALASLTRKEALRSAGRIYRHDVAVGYDRSVRAFISAQGGDLGGACLPDGLWLDADSSRRADYELRRSLLRDRSRLAAIRASGPVRPDASDGIYALGDIGCTAARLLLRYADRHPHEPWGSFGTLKAHEAQHVADVRRHLPLLRGLPATIELFVSEGFSASGVEMELERRAQLGACVDAPDPDLALAEMLMMLPVEARDPFVHAGGYRRGVYGLVLHIASHPERFPTVDPRKRIVTQLDRLTNDQIRRAARAVLGR